MGGGGGVQACVHVCGVSLGVSVWVGEARGCVQAYVWGKGARCKGGVLLFCSTCSPHYPPPRPDQDPYFNEPSNEVMRGKKEGASASTHYNAEVGRGQGGAWAMGGRVGGGVRRQWARGGGGAAYTNTHNATSHGGHREPVVVLGVEGRMGVSSHPNPQPLPLRPSTSDPARDAAVGDAGAPAQAAAGI